MHGGGNVSVKRSVALLLAVVAVSALVGGAAGQIFTVASYSQTANGAAGYGLPANTAWYVLGIASITAAHTLPKASTSACTATSTDSLASPTVVGTTTTTICLNSESGGFTSTDTVFYVFLTLSSSFTASQEWVFHLYFESPTNSETGVVYLETPSSETEDGPGNAMVVFDTTYASWTDAYVTDYELQDASCSAVGTCP